MIGILLAIVLAAIGALYFTVWTLETKPPIYLAILNLILIPIYLAILNLILIAGI